MALQRHLLQHHNLEGEELKRALHCLQCKGKLFSTPYTLQVHMQSHIAKKKGGNFPHPQVSPRTRFAPGLVVTETHFDSSCMFFRSRNDHPGPVTHPHISLRVRNYNSYPNFTGVKRATPAASDSDEGITLKKKRAKGKPVIESDDSD